MQVAARPKARVRAAMASANRKREPNKNAKFFRITNFSLYPGEIVTRKIHNPHPDSGRYYSASARRQRRTRYGADRNRQNIGLPDPRHRTASGEIHSRNIHPGAGSYSRTGNAGGGSVQRAARIEIDTSRPRRRRIGRTPAVECSPPGSSPGGGYSGTPGRLPR